MELPESEGTYFSGPSIQFGDNVNEVTGVSGPLANQHFSVGQSVTVFCTDMWQSASGVETYALDDLANAPEPGAYSMGADRAALIAGLALMVRYLAGGRYELDEAAPVDAGRSGTDRRPGQAESACSRAQR